MSAVPVGIICAMYIGFSLFKPEYTKKVLIIFLITGIVYYFAIFLYPDEMFGGSIPVINPGEIELADFSIKSVALYLVIFYISCVIVILGGGFYHLSKRITGDDQKRVFKLFLAFILYAIAAIMDVLFPLTFIAIARFVMIVSYYFLYQGFAVV